VSVCIEREKAKANENVGVRKEKKKMKGGKLPAATTDELHHR
jgi:hypothetical protein